MDLRRYDEVERLELAEAIVALDVDQFDSLRSNAAHPFEPPLVGLGAPLTDVVVHGEDVRIPLGLERSLPEDHLRAVLDFAVDRWSSPVVADVRPVRTTPRPAAGVHRPGLGGRPRPTVEGSARQLVRAVFGCMDAAQGLTGDGFEVLSSRCG